MKSWWSSIVLISLVLTVVSCVTVPGGSGRSASGSSATSAGSGSSSRQPSEETAFASRAVGGFNLTPRNGEPVFMGVADRLRDRHGELDVALRDIADQASRYLSVRASYLLMAGSTGQSTEHLSNIEMDWDKAAAKSLLEKTHVIREVQGPRATYVLATVAGLPPIPKLSAPPPSSSQPHWIDSPPQFNGFLVGVGVAERRRSPHASVEAADKSALASLLLQARATVSNTQAHKSVEGQGTVQGSTTAQASTAALSGFYLLARYVSPNGSYYYSLALAASKH